MKPDVRRLAIALLPAAAICTACAARTSTSSAPLSETGAVESVARDYIEGWYTGDVDRMDRALHADLVKRLLVNDDSLPAPRLHPISKERMIELTEQGGGEDPEADLEIFVDDVATEIATARVLSPEYLDYLHLAKTPQGWKIVNILFQVRD